MRERRRALGYRSMPDFALAAGKSPRTIGGLERGDGRVSDDTIAAVERVLQWEPGSVDRILSGGQPVESTSPELRRVVEAWPLLDDRARRVLLAVLEVLRQTS